MNLDYSELCPHDYKWHQTVHRNYGSMEVRYRCRICGAEMFDIEWQDMLWDEHLKTNF